MITKAQLKEYASLKEKKYRSALGKIFVEGKRLVEDALQSNYTCEAILATENFLDSHSLGFLSSHEVETISEKEFKLLSDTQTTQGIGAVLQVPVFHTNINSIDTNCVLYFDEIRDPGNAGTMIRTAAWFGIKDIIVSKNSVDVFNPKVVRSSMGALFLMNIIEDDGCFGKIVEAKKSGFQIVGAELSGENIFTFTPSAKTLILMGSEADGISAGLKTYIDAFVTIPKRGMGESLNVGVAASIIISQLQK